MAEDYRVLAQVYDTLGMADFSTMIVERLLDYALSNDWLGQNIMDFGCGPGAAAAWLAEDRFSVTGIDNHPDMIAAARARTNTATWEQADIRQVGASLGQKDMIFAIDVLNEMESIKDVKAMFQSAQDGLRDEGWFIFDTYTLRGLHNRGTAGSERRHDGGGVLMYADNEYDYERQIATRRHTTFIHQEGNAWERKDTIRVLRGFPVQALSALLQRTGFGNAVLLDPTLRPVDPRDLGHERVIFVAQK